MTGIASYASGLLGAMIVLVFLSFIASLLGSGLLFAVVGISTKTFPRIHTLTLLRYLLLVTLSAILVIIIAVSLLAIIQTASSPVVEILNFLDGMLTQLAFGISYYYAVSLFFNEAAFVNKELQV